MSITATDSNHDKEPVKRHNQDYRAGYLQGLKDGAKPTQAQAELDALLARQALLIDGLCEGLQAAMNHLAMLEGQSAAIDKRQGEHDSRLHKLEALQAELNYFAPAIGYRLVGGRDDKR